MCWHSNGWRWERAPEPTSEPVNTDDLRIADSDRERVIAQLSKHAGEGRLTLEEFEERVEAVYAARTNADLRPVFRGLPRYDDALARRPLTHTRPRIAVNEIVRLAVLAALVVWAAIAFGAWALLIAFWILVPKRGRRWNRHHRVHRVDDGHSRRARDEELTSV